MAETIKKTGKTKKNSTQSKQTKSDFVKEVIKIVQDNNISEFRYEKNDIKIMIKRGGDFSNKGFPPEVIVKPLPVSKINSKSKPAVAMANSNVNNYHEIKSPMVGTFYEAPSPGAAPFVKIGDHVNEDTTVCIVEAMKLMNEIKAGTNGVIKEKLIKNEESVHEGTVMFRIETA